jgi:hypothetical protein
MRRRKAEAEKAEAQSSPLSRGVARVPQRIPDAKRPSAVLR